MSDMIALGVYSAFFLNGIVQLGLGIRHIREDPKGSALASLFQWGILFIAVFLLWLVFAYLLAPLSLGFMEWFLAFPLAALVCRFFEYIWRRLAGRTFPQAKGFSAQCAYDGLAAAALLITLRLALSPLEAAVLSLGFALGGFLAALILNAALLRSSMEAVPAALRGVPLSLISMGLLALILASASGALLRVCGLF